MTDGPQVAITTDATPALTAIAEIAERLPLTMELTSERVDAVTYRFRGSNGNCSWAICTVNDQTGELLITSDAGNWAYRWNVLHLGSPTLHHFLSNRSDVGYLANKLSSREEREAFDPEKTVAEWRGWILEKRRELRIDRDIARELWGGLGGMSSCDDVNDFVRRWWDIENHGELFGDGPSEHLRYSPTGPYNVLHDAILPALCIACGVRCETDDELIEAGIAWAAKARRERDRRAILACTEIVR